MRFKKGSRLSMGSRASILAAAMSMTVALAGCSSGADASSEGKQDAGPVVVYGPAGLSGNLATSSKALAAGFEAAAATINAKGGILGREVKIELENDQSEPTQAVSLVTRRIAEDRPTVVFAGTSSAESLAVLPLVTREKLFSLAVAASPVATDPKTFPYNFSTSPVITTSSDALARRLVERGFKKVGIVYSDDVSSQAFVGEFKKAFPAAGLEVVAAESYAPDTVDVSSQLQRIDSKAPDVVVVSGIGKAPYVLKSRIKVGMGNVPFVGDPTQNGYDYSKAVTGEEAANYEGQAFTSATTTGGGSGKAEILKALADHQVKIESPVSLYGQAYDLLMLYANAVEQEHSFDVDKLKTAIEAGLVDKKFGMVNTDNGRWTAASHSLSADDLFTFVPIVPMVDGQFKLS